jgi:RNA polymerase sigma-70 factor (ECF subfamily)
VLAAGEGDDERAREALSRLCQIYWRPVFAFLCRRGYSVSDAQDLTQDFFVRVIRGSLLQRADPERGRFRSLLLKTLQNFLIDAHDKSLARKRGGDYQFISWDEWTAEAPSQMTLSAKALESWPAERLFDVRWATTVVEQAMRQLREECESRGRRRAFDIVSPFLSADRADMSYSELSKTLGSPLATTKNLIHQMRRRYRDLLRAAVAETVASPEQIDDEVRYLCSTLALTEN